MDVYIYAANIYCEDCGAKICDQLDAEHIADEEDSETYPQGPYDDGGGEADSPQHCGSVSDCVNAIDVETSDGRAYKIGAFLENPLTDYGRIYVRERLKDPGLVIKLWADFYDIKPASEE